MPNLNVVPRPSRNSPLKERAADDPVTAAAALSPEYRGEGTRRTEHLGPVAAVAPSAGRGVVLACVAALLLGCQSPAARPPGGYQTVSPEPNRDADLARRENARAVALMDEGKFADAEAALKSALDADVMCGPAHNNLGKIYFRQGKLYLAAWEFQYAMKLMPNQPEPPNNLGLVFEAAGKLDEAADSYGKAAAIEPENVDVLGNLARARYRRGDRDPELRALLGRLVLRETRPDWLAWERSVLSRLEAGADNPAP
jgi:tetratricopeptide (TPR) repeat protein